jgi:DNA-binding CsgD family transcriptional regulator
MASSYHDDLFPDTHNPEGLLLINERCLVRTQEGHRVVIVSGVVLAQYAVGDCMAEAYAMVSLLEQGWANQKEVARAFNCSERTVRRHQRRFEEGGLAALGHGNGYPEGRRRLRKARGKQIHRLKSQGHSNREIARRLGLSETAIRKSLRRLGWKEVALQSDQLPFQEEQGANPNLSAMETPSDLQGLQQSNPSDRRQDRLLAYLGLLDDAPPVFGSGDAIARAGVLLAVPALEESGIFECAQKIYGSLGPAFYGLRTSLLTLLLMALWRIKRPEALKEHSPTELGRVLGLDRAPEVKTIRRKLARLAAYGKATELGRALAQRRMKMREEVMGFLYIDGHVRVYHGQHRLPKTHVARMRRAMPATSDYWINDSSGDPLFVLTAEANAGLVKMLPQLLEEIREWTGERRITVVFDRGGYSPKLFKQIVDAGFDLMTYRKGRYRRIPRNRFRTCRTRRHERSISYVLADQEVRLLKGKLSMRQVTRLTDDGHQTPILTTRRDLAAAEVAYRMFDRWRQENFFKYLREEYALDALIEHAVEPDNPHREIPNPAWAAMNAQVRQAQAQLDQLQAEYGLEAFANLESQRRTMRGFRMAHTMLGKKIEKAFEKLQQLQKRRDKVPRRIPVQETTEQPIVKLAAERKHLTNLIKMVAYQSESALLRLVAPHYRRVDDEGRTLIQSALSSAADLKVTETELQVTLAPMSSPHRTRAIAALCEELNRFNAVFPGTKLRLRYAIREAN